MGEKGAFMSGFAGVIFCIGQIFFALLMAGKPGTSDASSIMFYLLAATFAALIPLVYQKRRV